MKEIFCKNEGFLFILPDFTALGIEEKILFVRNQQKDCNGKPDPRSSSVGGERPKYHKPYW